MIPGRPRCSEESLAREESLMATASLVTTWLLIEQPGAWGPDAIVDSRFPDHVVAPLLQRTAGTRVLLIRQRGGSDGDRTVFVAHSGGDGSPPTLRADSLSDPADLLDLDLEGIARGGLPEFGEPVAGPLYLVCTHGRHDVCCADKGRPLFRALSGHRPGRTWEVSHVGGDRFAGNLVVLPRGDYFGRVEAGDSSELVDRYEAGLLDLEHHRGRSIHPRLVQAAEHHVRAALSLTGFDDLELTDYVRVDHHHAEVVFAGPDGDSHRVRVAARDISEPEYLTCRAAEPGHPVVYDLQLL